MNPIPVKVIISNDHSKKTDTYYRTRIVLDPEDPDVQSMVTMSLNKFDPTLDLREFKPKIILKATMEV